MINKYLSAIEWDFQTIGINVLEYFQGRPDRDFSQFLRFYETFMKVRGSYIQASYLDDPEVIEEMIKVPEAEWSKRHPPALFGWTELVDKITDVGDQLIAQRAHDAKKVKFYPRPKIKAAELRKEKRLNTQDDKISQSRNKNLSRRGL